MNSGNKKDGQYLQSLPRAQDERFLAELVNLEPTTVGRFLCRYRGFFPDGSFIADLKSLDVEALMNRYPESFTRDGFKVSGAMAEAPDAEEIAKIAINLSNLFNMRSMLREAWDVADLRRKEWKLFALRVQFQRIAAGSVEQMNEPPPSGGLDHALRFLAKIPERVKVCQNPSCDTRYFIAPRRSRLYCSEPCARPAQIEYKQKWWADHSDEFKKKRKKRSAKPRKPRSKRANP